LIKAGKEVGSKPEDDDVDNQSSPSVQAFKKADSVENASDNVVKRCRKDTEVIPIRVQKKY
jgi:hypothetical protein